MWMNTGQTLLTWRWIPSAGAMLTGQLTWPDSYDAAEAHAAALLDVAEQGLVAGCASQTLPDRRQISSRIVTRLDETADEDVRRLSADYAAALGRWGALQRCLDR
jgi:hypothetical protein